MAGMDKLSPDNRNAYQHAGNDHRKAETTICLEDAGRYQKMQKKENGKGTGTEAERRKVKTGYVNHMIMPEISAVHM